MMYLNMAFSVAPVVGKPEMIFKLNAAAVNSYAHGVAQGSGKI
jgi:hypothetical protein